MPNIETYLEKEDLESIGKFTATWALFEQEIFAKKCKMAEIDSVISSGEITNENLEYLTSALRKEMIACSGSTNNSLLNLKFRSKNRNDNTSKFRRKQTQLWLNETILCTYQIPIWVIFRIRCNMFHGEKTLWNLHRQKDIFEICTEILEFYVREKENSDVCTPLGAQQ